jgi:uracil-DNA glycosylase
MDSTSSILIQKHTAKMMALPERLDNSPAHASLQLWQNEQHKLTCYYAPFDHVNQDADIIIVGITPGRTQMNRAINAFRQEAKQSGYQIEDVLKHVKQTASLSGSMRPTIVKVLNKLAINKRLAIPCCSQLWQQQHHRVHFCSLLKYPIFINGRDYNGQLKLFNSTELIQLLYQGFVSDLKQINPKAIILPLGEMVASTIQILCDKGDIRQRPVFHEDKVIAPPHPSGANAESIALLLAEPFPSLNNYQDQMYRSYLEKHQTKNKVPAQSETQYKNAREARWQAISLVRQTYLF